MLAPGAQNRASLGIAYEAGRNRLWVAGGGPGFALGIGDVRVYDASSGTLLATFLPPGDVGALNDVAITHDAVYVTDSFNAQLVKIPLPADGSLPSEDSATLLPVSGVAEMGGPNLNGIVAKSGVLLVGRPARGSSSASTLTLGSPSRSTLATRTCPARMVWSCGGTRCTWSAAAW